MMSRISSICIFFGCLSLASVAGIAQEVVHALTGTVNNINLTAKTITVITDDGSDGTFKDMTSSHTSIEFDKDVRTDATAADEFKKSGARVIVYYFGFGKGRTVVALRSLGPGPFTKSPGTVVKFEKGKHSLSIKDRSGAIESFEITRSTVVETGSGAVEGPKFEPGKGDQVQVISTEVNGSATALFVYAM
jgi:hypothetical protein